MDPQRSSPPPAIHFSTSKVTGSDGVDLEMNLNGSMSKYEDEFTDVGFSDHQISEIKKSEHLTAEREREIKQGLSSTMAESMCRVLRDGALEGELAPSLTIKDSILSPLGLHVFNYVLSQISSYILAGKSQSRGLVLVAFSRSPSFYLDLLKRSGFDDVALDKWYATDYGMFRFCIAHTEEGWREGTEQYKFIEHCLASVDRQKQPWLIFLAHRVLGYSSNQYYANEGTTEEPMGRESLQKLWQKYKVDVAIYGHVHNYERTCPIYQNTCTRKEKDHYEGPLNGTIHIVAGGAGASLTEFTSVHPNWSLFRDFDYGFTKLTAFDHSNLLFEYKKSRDGKVYDSFRISRDYRDILACAIDSCYWLKFVENGQVVIA